MSEGDSSTPITPTPGLNPSQTPGNPLQNPQVLAALITGVVTVVVAIVGLVPVLMQKAAPTPTPPAVLVVTSTPTIQSATDIPVALPTDSMTNQPIASDTPVPPTATAQDTETPVQPTEAAASTGNGRPNVRLIYDADSFTLLNLSNQNVSLEGITFTSANGFWDARDWGPSLYDRVPSGNCLRLRDMRVGNRTPPAECRSLLGLILVGEAALFWTNTEIFTVERNGEVLAECSATQSPCELRIRKQ